jgi:hypothetical protein
LSPPGSFRGVNASHRQGAALEAPGSFFNFTPGEVGEKGAPKDHIQHLATEKIE